MKRKIKMIDALSLISDDRNISEEIVLEALKEALAKAYRNHIDIQDVEVRVEINPKNNKIEVYHRRKVVEEVEDDELEISLEDAKRIKSSYELDDYVDELVDYHEFGRKAVVLAKNVVKQKTREAQKQAIYDEYIDCVGDMVNGIVETVEEKFVLVNIGNTIGLMPKVAQIPNEKYVEGQTIKVVISSVSKETKGAQILVSRADANFVKRLFEKEVPEIYQGIIEIKAIAREAGERTKMAVYSNNENIDPIGACIGPKGQRVQAIINELNGEKIDIFEWSENVTKLIENALAPADVLAVINNPLKHGLMVIVKDDQLSLAIGKKGKNARLAVKLTNKTIDIKSESEAADLDIDWQAIYAAEQAEQEAIIAKERAEMQKAKFSEWDNENDGSIENEIIDELLGDEIIEEEFIPEEQENEQSQIDEMEEAAKLAKELKKNKSLEEKRSYVSKFEDIAGVKKEEPVQVTNKKKVEEKEVEEEISEPTHNPNEENILKPIYTEEELAEIAAQEAEEAANDWINDDDIDFDEYDEYYDNEK